LFEYAKRFDGAQFDSLAVSEKEIEKAYNSRDAEFIAFFGKPEKILSNTIHSSIMRKSKLMTTDDI
jgi:histidinol dehydrogenase